MVIKIGGARVDNDSALAPLINAVYS